MIVLRPGSGLCNRLRAMGSAIKLAREVSADLRVEWFRCPIRRWSARCGMRAGFRNLFEPIDGVDVRERIVVRNEFPWVKRIYSSSNPFFSGEENRQEFAQLVKANPRQTRWIWTCYAFYPNDDFSWLQPRKELCERIKSGAANFGDNCIGLHIRRSDNKNSTQYSPLSLFTTRIEDEIAKDEAVRFFVSSDDESVKAELRQRYGSRILLCEQVGARYTIKGEQDAVVDLFLLAHTNKLYGSFWSSFSEVAAQIGKIPLEVVANKGCHLPKWEMK